MKLGRRTQEREIQELNKPALNKGKKQLSIVIVIAVIAGLIVWVLSIGKKAEETVKVAMLAEPVYKNQVITEDVLMSYDMLRGEYEKYAIVDDNGNKSRRLILWDEVGEVLNSFAAYPLQQETFLEYRDLIKSKIDNSDSVLYSFPGKDIVKLDMGQSDLSAFKTFLRPGDKLNIEAIYSERVQQEVADGYGGTTTEDVEVFRTDTVFNSIMLADLINAAGESILDIYENYNNLTVWQQSQLDQSSSFQSTVEPTALLVALTPEEKDIYYYYLSKNDVTFRVSMPQRSE